MKFLYVLFVIVSLSLASSKNFFSVVIPILSGDGKVNVAISCCPEPFLTLPFLTLLVGDAGCSSSTVGCSGGKACALELDDDPPIVTFGRGAGSFTLAFFSGDCARQRIARRCFVFLLVHLGYTVAVLVAWLLHWVDAVVNIAYWV